jgi:hypothetical protein
MKYLILLLFFLSLTSSISLCRELTGAVYWDHSGPSAAGTGYVQLSTESGLVVLHYPKPVKTEFSDKTCDELGAIWTVQTKQSSRATEELVSTKCDGGLNTSVHGAWLAVREFIRVAAESAGYTVGYDPNRRGPIRMRLAQVETDVSGYLNFGSTGMCLEIRTQADQRIVIKSSGDCYFWPDLYFTVERDASSVWRVTSVAEDPTERPAPIIPGATRPSFDCTKARTPTELLICGNDYFAMLDSAMANAYRGALERLSKQDADRLRREQSAWYRQYARECDSSTSDALRKACVTHYLIGRIQQI